MTATLGWIVSQIANFHLGQTSKIAGAPERAFTASFSKAAADGDGSIYYMAALPADAVLSSLLLNNDALAGATSASIGFMKLNDDGSISDNAKSDGTSGLALLMAATDINAGSAIGSERNALAALAIADLGKKVWELLGYTFPNNKKNDTYVLALKLTTAGAAAGNLAIRGKFAQG